MLANLSKVILFFDGHFPVNISYGQLVLLLFNQYSPKYTTMETEHIQHPVSTQSNRLLIKGLITGGLILLMLIPGLFITSLVKEREERHKEVVKEVSSKWAGPQTISGPYLVVPYLSSVTNADGKVSVSRSPLIVLPENLDASAQLVPEKRPRSIYKVLLYKSAVAIKGNFKANWPQDINPLNVDLANAKICFGLSDFKGIEDDIYVNIGKEKMLLNPGLPVDDLGKTGLMSTLPLTTEMMASGVPFEMNVSLRGSGQFRFMPLAASSKFKMISSWPDPSFDGNTLPDNDRVVNDKGFSAKWNFNRANLPFGTVLQPGQFVDPSLSFGVSLVQVADQYNKTMRSVKYAILFVGLTFALFFIVEILQRKPFHPVQYVLVGLALTIFYSLLLSFSEYILFDQAYLIAAAATILLISLYAKGHFQSWKTAAVFAGVLCCLYGFIFTLIRLEDNALIVGSIGLFIVLALVMYVSRKINWYGQPHSTTAIQI
ncbi:MAG: cell envelope integrity protein CreD [Pedobacter sp.]|nr:MAG: cell envelope integrity protein CreD [Pedobacter sp.]